MAFSFKAIDFLVTFSLGVLMHAGFVVGRF
jgi:hypothetical protein